MTILKGTGMEMGSLGVFSGSSGALSTITVHTGTYSLVLGYNHFATMTFTAQNGVYISLWLYMDGNDDYYFEFRKSSTALVHVKRNTSSQAWDVYRGAGAALLASGSIVTVASSWYHIQVHITIHDTTGVVETWIDGVQDINFSGDTQPGSDTTGDTLYIYQYLSGALYIDDITVGDEAGGQLPDIRYDLLVPDGDDSVEWTPSTGVDNYALVDEVPPSDVDYVSVGSPNFTDVYTLGDWSGSAKTPQFLVAWVRAKKDVAGARQLSHGLRSGGSDDLTGAYNLTTDFKYYDHIITDDPDGGGALDDTVIDGLKFVLESE